MTKMRVALTALMMLVTAPAWAEWVKVTENDTGVYYYDPATIRKDGNLRRVWALFDRKERHPAGNLSVRSMVEFDCTEGRRTVQIGAGGGVSLDWLHSAVVNDRRTEALDPTAQRVRLMRKFRRITHRSTGRQSA